MDKKKQKQKKMKIWGKREMFKVQLDEKIAEEMLLQEIKKRVSMIESRFTYWDLDELCRQTCMSINNIKDKFFYDPKFPKYKIGGKWYMPAQECEAFLLKWIKEQSKD